MEKELRYMSRPELIETICTLRQNEEKLREENEKLSAELKDRKIRLEQSGSIAEAALGLNHVFEAAQAAADLYLESVRDTQDTQAPIDQSEEIIEEARQKAEEFMAAAHRNAQADAVRELEQVRSQCEKERQAVKEFHEKFLQDMSDILKDNPELMERVHQMGTLEGE